MWIFGSSKLFLFPNEVHLNSVVRLLLELYCVRVIKHVDFFTNWARIKMAFTFTSLPLNFYTSVSGCGCGFGFDISGLTDLAKKEHRSADLHTPINPFLTRSVVKLVFWSSQRSEPTSAQCKACSDINLFCARNIEPVEAV